MRVYYLTNMYFSGIHAGIQASHALSEMFMKYCTNSDAKNDIFDWALNHKTACVLNGGNNKQMKELEALLIESDTYVWASFYESDEAAGGLLTSIAVLSKEDTDKESNTNIDDFVIRSIINNAKLMN